MKDEYEYSYPMGGSDLPRPRAMPTPQENYGTRGYPSRESVALREDPYSQSQHERTRNEDRMYKSQKDYGSDTQKIPLSVMDTSEDDEAERMRRIALARTRRTQEGHPRKSCNTKDLRNRKRVRSKKSESRQGASSRQAGRGFSPLKFFVCILVVLFVGYSGVSLVLIACLDRVSTGTRSCTSGTMESTLVKSVLLIGTDSRDTDTERGRSDSIILLSINYATGKMFLTSFLRDAYVTIPGYGSSKLNSAYSYGGAELLMDTLEYNYNLSIDDYICVSFSGFASIVDAFGGVEITLSDSEAEAVNDILYSEVNELLGYEKTDGYLDGGGTYILTGKQALSYARIRYVGNADFERTSRQREVLTTLLSQAKTRAVTALPSLMSTALPETITNMEMGEMYLLSLTLPVLAVYEIEQIQIPADGTWSNATIGGQSVLEVDFSANQSLLESTIFGG